MADEAAIGARERKLLFFLEQFSSARNSLVAPYWVTQAGIAERTGLSQPNVSTALRVLLARGLAAGRVGLVEGGPRTKTVYFLTEEGMNLAARLSEDTPTPVSHPPALPVARPVFGREREQRALSEWLRSGKTRVMYIQGLAGIGKTTLLLAFLERARTSTSLFYFPIHPWTTATQLFGELAEFLAALGRPGLRDLVGGALRHGAPLDFGAALFRTCEELRGLRALIALEDYHDASQAVRDVVSVLAAGDAGLAVNIIANGRGPASPFEARAVRAGQVELLKLGGLDREAVGEMLSQRASTGAGVPADLERIVRATGGNPLFVQLLPADADISRPSDLRAFLAQEIESRLPADEVGLLRALCVHRGPVPLEAFAAPGQVDLVGDLIARSLVEPGDSESRYGMHAMLREFFYHSLTRAEREVWHSAAATHYGTRLGESAAVERLWHLAAAGDPAKFATALLASGPDLLRSGHGVALLSAIMSCGSGPFDPQVRLMQARCHLAVGDLDGARVAFEAARGAAAEEGDRARALEGIAHCHSMSGEAPEAMRSCARGLRHASAIRDPTTRRSVRASLLKELGSARIVAGLHRKAIEALELARRAAETLDDDRL
ncbi:MAG TPA: AAA family ATPase, partial [Thermoplasmata archaeon]|nr:AAA family ATPase [Thermoplasmata archaeon]